MSEDYKKGFAEGFEAGYKAGKSSTPLKPNWPNTPYPQDWTKSSCSVCGMVFELGKAYGYVCGNSNCPSKIMSSTTGITYSTNTIPNGLSYEEIYGSVVYQQNNKKKE